MSLQTFLARSWQESIKPSPKRARIESSQRERAFYAFRDFWVYSRLSARSLRVHFGASWSSRDDSCSARRCRLLGTWIFFGSGYRHESTHPAHSFDDRPITCFTWRVSMVDQRSGTNTGKQLATID